MVNGSWACVVLSLLLAPPALSATGARFRLDSKTISPEEFGSPFLEMAVQWATSEESEPEALKAAPPKLPDSAAFFLVHLGNRKVFMLVLRGRAPKLYVDTDMDNDLSDEKPVTGKRLRSGTIGWGAAYQFDAVRAPSSQPSGRAEPEIRVILFNQDYLIVVPKAYRSGTVEINRKRYRVCVVDANYNGRYDNVIEFGRGDKAKDNEPLPAYDSLAIDLNGDGEFAPARDSVTEVMPLPKLLRFGDDYYAFRIEPDGSSVIVEKTTPKFGTLDVGQSDAELLLWSETGVHHLKGSGGKWQLPEGSYSCYMIRLNMTDSKKNKSTLLCRGNTGNLNGFEIGEGKTTSFKIGPPLTAQAKVNLRRQMFRRTAVISASVVGREGEQYLAGVQKNGQMQPAPRIKILDSNGKVVESGKLEYG